MRAGHNPAAHSLRRLSEMTSALYNSPRVAAGYAFARPPVHERVLHAIRDRVAAGGRVGRALDVGCGAGRSTAALVPFANAIVGIDPAAAMLAHRRSVAPGALFVVGNAERLPFAARAFDLATAAGSINYTDPASTLKEVARVLAPGGTLVIYDFSAGRRSAGGTALEEWYSEFDRRHPDSPGYAMDVRNLPFDACGLRLDAYEELQVPIPMSLASYLQYAMSETRVELAISRGARDAEIRDWCRRTLVDVFGDAAHEVIFDAYAACARHAADR